MDVIRLENLPDPLIKCPNKEVYSPSEDSFLLIDYFKKNIDEISFDGINLRNIENILDMGTGTGIIAIYLQLLKSINPSFKSRIIASDIMEESIKCAKINEELNNINEEITFVHSDLFKSFPKNLKSSINIIIFNPPYLPSSKLMKSVESKWNVDYSWDGGEKGFETSLRFLEDAKMFLNLEEDHYIYIINSSRTDSVEFEKSIQNLDYNCEIVKKKHYFFEDIVLNRLTHVKY
ncbi:MAG: HemK2/MTQ2 family protein methyltransferase [Promethearchaeota archaeon]|jgi:HemK-related putative methylase